MKKRFVLVIFVVGLLGSVPALAQGVEFFLHDDPLDPREGLLDELAPVLITDSFSPPDLNGDGDPGLTVVKGADPNDPSHSHQWASGFQPERCFSGFGRVHLFTVLKDFISDESSAVNVSLVDRDPNGNDISVIGRSGSVLDPWEVLSIGV